LPVVVVNPAQVRAFTHALGKRAKTDPIDAAVIAHFAETTKPQIRQLPDETTQMLADLVARRRQIVEMIAAESQRGRRVTSEHLKKSIARLGKALEYVKRSKPQAQGFTCRPIRRTSIRSSNSSQNSKLCYEKPPSAPSRVSGTASDAFSMPSCQMNAPTTSATRDMLQVRWKLL
jgi:hypothetical protein